MGCGSNTTPEGPPRLPLRRCSALSRSLRSEGPFLCRFLDAGGADLTARSDGRRPKSARARSRGQPGRRLGVERYGDFRVASHSLKPGHRGDATRMPGCGDGRGSGRSVPAGSEGYRRAPGGWVARNRVERDRRRRGAIARERQSGGADRRVRLMTCRTSPASAATLARSRGRRPR